jgi:hypothetical protein
MMAIAGSLNVQEIRRYIACVLFGFSPATFSTDLWLFSKYVKTRPLVPNYVLGLTHPLNNHGTYYYLSAVESASVDLAFWAGWIALFVATIVVPKEFVTPPPNTPGWVTHISSRFKTGLEKFKFSYFMTTLMSFLICIAMIILFGAEIVQFAIALGLAPNYSTDADAAGQD